MSDGAQGGYPDAIAGLLQTLRGEAGTSVAAAAGLMRKSLDGAGLVYAFGSGHSSLFVEEAFHRAGGLIPVHPILHPFLSPHTSPKVSGKLERLDGLAPILFARSGARAGDVMWIASNSGINAASVDMAGECRKAGVATVALTNLTHSRATPSRSATGKKLYELCDVVIDNHCPVGDAMVEIAGVRVAAGSTIANCFLYNWALTLLCEGLAASGKTLPIYKSANLPGGDAHNETIEAPYRARIPQL